MVQTSISVQTKVLLVSAAALATGLGAYALGYYEYDWRLWNLSPEQIQQEQVNQQVPVEQPVQEVVQQPTVTLITDPRLPDATVGSNYSVRLSASSGPTTRWVLEQGALPAGLNLDETTGLIFGVPTEPAQSLFRLKFGTDQGAGLSQFTLNVVTGEGVSADVQPEVQTEVPQPQGKITTDSVLPNGRVGQRYQMTLQAVPESRSDRNWRISSANRIPGLTLDAATGALTGLPTQSGTYVFAVTVSLHDTDRPMHPYDVTKPFTLAISPAEQVPPRQEPVALNITGGYPDGGIGGYYSSNPLQATGGRAPYEWSISGGNIPSGLSFSPNSQISGYANQYGIFTFMIQVRDQDNRVARAERTIHIRPAQPVASASIDPDLSNRLRRIDLIGVQVHDLIKLQEDGNPDTQYDTTVYYIGADGRRHSFPNPKVYFSWFADFSRVRVVASRELADIPLGANLTYRPGTRLVKFMTDPRVYAVDSDRRLRWMKTESVAQASYGPFWARQVDDISDAFYMDYRFGQDIDRPGDYSVTGAKATAVFPSDVLPR